MLQLLTAPAVSFVCCSYCSLLLLLAAQLLLLAAQLLLLAAQLLLLAAQLLLLAALLLTVQRLAATACWSCTLLICWCCCRYLLRLVLGNRQTKA